jgi:hypothetical protein
MSANFPGPARRGIGICSWAIVAIFKLDELLEPWRVDQRGRAISWGCRFLGTVEQTPKFLGMSEKKAKRDWSLPKAWLHGNQTEESLT